MNIRNFKNIILIGFMGSGKTTVGKSLAKKLNYKFLDTDVYIIKKTGKEISQIFQDEGEKKFRDEEKQVVKNILKLKNYVIATGGGMVVDKENLKDLKKSGLVIWLKATPEDIYERTKNDTSRPLLPSNKKKAKQTIEILLAKRFACYSQCDFMVNTSYFSIKKITEIILAVAKVFTK